MNKPETHVPIHLKVALFLLIAPAIGLAIYIALTHKTSGELVPPICIMVALMVTGLIIMVRKHLNPKVITEEVMRDLTNILSTNKSKQAEPPPPSPPSQDSLEKDRAYIRRNITRPARNAQFTQTNT